jgi:hypothetical protein
LIAGEPVKKVGKKKQRANEGKNAYEEQHRGVAFPGNS